MSNVQLKRDVRRAWRFGKTLLLLAEQKLFLTVQIADCNQTVLATQSAWAGGVNPSSRAPKFGPAKADELVKTIGRCPQIPIATTPVDGYEQSTGLRGGIRVQVGNLYYIVTASGWSDDCDLLFALIVMYKFLGNSVKLHHVGFRYAEEIQLREAVAYESAVRNQRPLYAPTDHERYYFVVRSRRGKSVLWQEEQYDSSDPTPGVHWDFHSDGNLLDWLSRHLGVEPELWKASAIDCFGRVQLKNRNGLFFAVMERLRWSTVEEWPTVVMK